MRKIPLLSSFDTFYDQKSNNILRNWFRQLWNQPCDAKVWRVIFTICTSLFLFATFPNESFVSLFYSDSLIIFFSRKTALCYKHWFQKFTLFKLDIFRAILKRILFAISRLVIFFELFSYGKTQIERICFYFFYHSWLLCKLQLALKIVMHEDI